MTHKYPHQSTSRDICAAHKVSEADLLAEYEDRILCGDNPDLNEYILRYTGPEPRIFRIELQLATALLLAGQQRRVASN